MKKSLPIASENKLGSLLRRRMLLSMAALPLLPSLAFADINYPTKPIRFIVPFTPGSGGEVAARFIGTKITELTGQPVIVEARGGGNGIIGVNAALSAPPDGYTLFFGSNSTLATNVALFKDLPYDPLKDFKPISLVLRSPIVLLTSNGSRYKTLADFVEHAKKEPSLRTIGTGSAGYQLMGALFGERAQFTYTNVPYKSAPETVIAVVSGQVDIGIVDITSSMPLIKSGRARPLAIASENRNPGIPSVPTTSEAGVKDFTAAPWNGVAAPARVPDEIVQKLSDLMKRVMAMPETKKYLGDLHVEVMQGGREEMAAYQREEVEKWKGIAAVAGVQAQ